jgi:DNA-binding SARP family transcriptional activator
MEFRVLGPIQALADGRALPLGGPKQRALLAELLLHRGTVVSRDHLIEAIWGEAPPESAAADLRRALAVWTGTPLADLADEPVAQAAVPRLHELRLRALELRNDARLALGEHDAILPELEAQITEEPYRERLREQQILALYRAGRQKEALDSYRDARRTFLDELGVDPGPGLQELERAILRQDEALAAPAPTVRRTVLPTPSTSLVGRRLEIAAVEAMLRRDDVRLVTLTGSGWTGKTRLAIAVAQELAPELRDGAVFVDLASVTDPELVLPTVAQALEVPSADDVLAALHDSSLLLVLDNLEQLDASVRPVAALLGAAPRLLVLATSRTPLRLSGEHEYPVPPLPVPSVSGGFEQLVETSRRSARGSTACRSRSSSPLPGCARSRRPRSSGGSGPR